MGRHWLEAGRSEIGACPLAQKYLSTDPTAGQPAADAVQTPEYLSRRADAGVAIPTQGTNTGLGLFTAGKGIPLAAHGALEVATSPMVPQIGATIGRVVGAAGPPLVGAWKGGVTGALAGAASAAGQAALGLGETGGRMTGELVQKAASPVAAALKAVAPYAQTLSTIAAPQTLLDLAQMSEPGRRDIGVLGIGATQNIPGQQPALINLAIQKVGEAVEYLMSRGVPQGEAVRTVMNLKVKGQ